MFIPISFFYMFSLRVFLALHTTGHLRVSAVAFSREREILNSHNARRFTSGSEQSKSYSEVKQT